MKTIDVIVTAFIILGCIGGISYMILFITLTIKDYLKNRRKRIPRVKGVPIDPGNVLLLNILYRLRDYHLKNENYEAIPNIDHEIEQILKENKL